MTRAFILAAALSIIACGGCNNGGGGGNSSRCSVVISGVPHGGTYKDCVVAQGGNGFYTLDLRKLPGCEGSDTVDACNANITFTGTGDGHCMYEGNVSVMVQDPAWTSEQHEAVTWCLPGNTDCGPIKEATPCTVDTSILTPLSLPAPNGHWAGTITAHLIGLDNSSSLPSFSSDVSITGSF